MNEFLPSRYVEIIHRLALGIEPIDAQCGRRLSYSLQVGYDFAQLGLPRPPIERHISNLFSLRYQPGLKSPVDVRVFDLQQPFYDPKYDRRRIVPRRLSIPVLSLSAVESAEKIDRQQFRRRIRRPVFFPGAAYDVGVTATALRGRVTRSGKAMRWARVVARLAGQTLVVGRAHGDDRGEFFLLVNANSVSGSSLPNPLNVDVEVSGPTTEPVPNPPNQEELDPLWDLPLEMLATAGSADPVATGETLPADYGTSVTQTITFTLGRCIYREFQIP
ncbi:MAG TPA: hypothetical protein VGO56_10665 [Pyrinomonadaceae bacterium]|jgi:hypothetical protein|nr:hypothetical protein [Pyrinomonadaceae bacterium]